MDRQPHIPFKVTHSTPDEELEKAGLVADDTTRGIEELNRSIQHTAEEKELDKLGKGDNSMLKERRTKDDYNPPGQYDSRHWK
jgi:hypothetical protein